MLFVICNLSTIKFEKGKKNIREKIEEYSNPTQYKDWHQFIF
jgi:hypothetical protein